MNRTALATITGLVLGLTLVFGNFGDMLIVALFGAIGGGEQGQDPPQAGQGEQQAGTGHGGPQPAAVVADVAAGGVGGRGAGP